MSDRTYRPVNQRQILGFDGKPLTSKPKSVIVPGTRRSAADVALTSPEIRNPLLNIVNFFLPYNYKVLNQWIRYYDRFHPMVGNCIDLHGYFPISKFDLKLGKQDEEVLNVYEDCSEEIELFQRFLEMSREFELIGEEYPYLHWSDELNFFDSMTLMNPDFINVKMHPLALGMKPTIELEPDELLKSLIQSNEPEDIEIKQSLDPVVISAVMMGQNIRIDQFNTEQIARKASPYEPRGTSIVLRILKDLLYEDKLREAQYSVADGMITPKVIYKLGDPNNGYMPTTEDLTDFRALLQAQAHDPLAAIVTHYGLSLEYVGAYGKILPIVPEFQFIEDRILTGLYTNKALTHGEGPCASSDTETLTRRGFKFYDEITDEDEIATYNSVTGKLEYHKPTGRVKFNVDSELILFENRCLDHFVTPNHKVWARKPNGKFEKMRADEVSEKYEFMTTPENGWDGASPEYVQVGDRKIPTNDYMRFVGLYLSEGSMEFSRTAEFVKTGNKSCTRPIEIRITQTEVHKSGLNPWYGRVKEAVLKAFPDAIERQAKRQNGNYGTFRIKGGDIAAHFLLNYGEGSAVKTVPAWVKSFGMDALKALIDGFHIGDGSDFSNSDSGFELNTVSKVLADDLQEICLKCGYYSKNSVRTRTGRKKLYRLKIHPFNIRRDYGFTPMLSKGDIKRIPYKGWVYCFEVPNRLFVMRRNGKICITHNTYANATVAMEALQGRYMAKREKLEDFAIRKIFTPVALANEFYEPLTEAQSSHGVRPSRKDRKLNIPTFEWKQKLRLVDDIQRKQMVINLRNRPIPEVSLRKIYDELGIDFDTEMQALKEEAKIMKQMKQDYGVENPLLNPGSRPGGQMPGLPGESGTTRPVQPPRDISMVKAPGGGGSKSSTQEPGGPSKTKEPGGELKGASASWNSELQQARKEKAKLLVALSDPPKFFSEDGRLKDVHALEAEAALRS